MIEVSTALDAIAAAIAPGDKTTPQIDITGDPVDVLVVGGDEEYPDWTISHSRGMWTASDMHEEWTSDSPEGLICFVLHHTKHEEPHVALWRYWRAVGFPEREPKP